LALTDNNRMGEPRMNPLVDCGLPLFFKVSDPDAVGLSAPPIRLGDVLTTWVRTLSSMQKEALVYSARTGLAWRLASDEGEDLNGLGVAPCPLAHFTTGMVASYMNEITAYAGIQGVGIKHLRLTLDNFYTMEGSMPRRTMVGGALPVELAVEIDCDLKGDALAAFVYGAVAASPLNGLLRGQLTSLFALALNGRQLGTGEAAPLDGAIHPDPGDRFAAAVPADDQVPLVTKGGMTPKIEGAQLETKKGVGYATDQSRKLHVRGICTLRDDGVKEIEKHMFRPHGAVFRFLSDEAPINGGGGRAPDANAYVSAGIGFCFMTQFGRYLSILKKEMKDYRLVQHTHFSLGGASGGTDAAGSADAVESHVYLQSPEGEEFARDILHMAEKTCFLHALCRTDLKPRIRVNP
jgi:hypothetical protein